MKYAAVAAVTLLVLAAGYYLLSGKSQSNAPVPLPTQNTVLPAGTPTSSPSAQPKTTKAMQLPKPEMTIDTAKDYKAVLKTDKGDITIDLHEKETPITVNNFVYLAKSGYYNGFPFHRVIEGFMIQGGDPEGTGRGGPGYVFDNEPFTGEYERGVVAMANAGRDTNGSQFFIMHADYPLPKDYVIFGNVVEGMDVVDAIATAEVSASSMGERSKPVTPVQVSSVQILEE